MSSQAPKDPESDPIEVGSFFLETLTTGMYENPFHCIREYIQNGFDAISDAVAGGLIERSKGEINLTIGGTSRRPSITVRDNGSGITSNKAYSTLVSIGASRKSPNRHAGFRGIGRLAGIAYCTTLRFTTSAHGESTATVVEFDCGRIRGFFTPGAEPKDVRHVVRTSVTTRTEEVEPDAHFTQVEMLGLVNLGAEFAQMEKLHPYLQQVSPVEYVSSFDFATRVRSLAASYGDALTAVSLTVKEKKQRTEIYKAYRNAYPTGKKNVFSTLVDIETHSSKEHGWYGWIGVSNFPGEITDRTVAGVRFRVKNLQIGDERLIEDLAEELTAGRSERRLQRYAVGEVFVTNTHVVPNARRDGFEDNQAWRDIKKDIKAHIAARVVRLIRDASDSRSLLKELESKRLYLNATLDAQSITTADRNRVEADLKRQLQILGTPSKLTGADPKEVSTLVSQFKELLERLAEIPVKDPPPPPPPEPPPPPSPPPSDPPPAEFEGKTLLDIVREVLAEELGAEEADRLLSLISTRAEEELP